MVHDKKRWRQIIRYHKSVYGSKEATNELFFLNLSTNKLGRIVAAGSGKRGKLANRFAVEKSKKFIETRYSLLMLLENSSGAYHNESGFECPLEYGDFFFGIPGCHHSTSQNRAESWGELCVEFDGNVFDILQQEKVLSFDRPVWHLENPDPWITRLMDLLRQPRPSTTVAALRETTAFLLILLEMLEVATPKSPAPVPNNWFHNACILLSGDLSKPLSLRTVAEEIGMGYENFRVKFHRQAGMPPGKYRDQQRCAAACSRLLNTRKPCWEIALYLGFYDEQHFSRRFKQWTGMSPQVYREKHAK